MSGMRYQPQGRLAIDWSNPITRGLVAAVHPEQRLTNLVGGKFNNSHPTETSFYNVINKSGKAFANGYSTNFGLSSDRFWTTDGGGTTAVVVIPRVLYGNGQIAVSHSSEWHCATLYAGDGTNPRFSGGSSGNGNSRTTAPENYVVGQVYSVVIASTEFAQVLAINGMVAARTTHNVGNLQYQRPFSVASPGTTGGMEYNLVLRWNRPLTEAEAVSISANPWQIFQKSSNDSVYNLRTVSGGNVNGDISMSGVLSNTVIHNSTASGSAQKSLAKINANSSIGPLILLGTASAVISSMPATTTAIGTTYALAEASAAIPSMSATTTAIGTTYVAAEASKSIVGVPTVSSIGTFVLSSSAEQSINGSNLTSSIHNPLVFSNTIINLNGVSGYLVLNAVTNYAHASKLLNNVNSGVVLHPAVGSGSSVNALTGLQSTTVLAPTNNSGASQVSIGTLRLTSFIGSLSINGQSQSDINMPGVSTTMAIGTVNLITNSNSALSGVNNTLLVRLPVLSGDSFKDIPSQNCYLGLGILTSMGTAGIQIQKIPVFFGIGNIIAFAGSGITANAISPSICSEIGIGLVLGRVRNQKSSFGYHYLHSRLNTGLINNKQ